jgi:hypothetical protein
MVSSKFSCFMDSTDVILAWQAQSPKLAILNVLLVHVASIRTKNHNQAVNLVGRGNGVQILVLQLRARVKSAVLDTTRTLEE